MTEQPFLHDQLVCVRAPAVIVNPPSGQLTATAAAGIYLGDRRILSRSELTVSGTQPVPVLAESTGPGSARFVSVVRGLGATDPTLTVTRTRTLTEGAAAETVEIAAHATVTAAILLRFECDLADISEVKSGRVVPPLAPDGLRWTGPDGTEVTVACHPRPDRVAAGAAEWNLALRPGDTARIELTVTVGRDPTPLVMTGFEGPSQVPTMPENVTNPRMQRLLRTSLADLTGLEVSDPRSPTDHLLAAGAPWYLTLFGRDALMAARMLLPLGTALAAGTLRTLARRQGTRVDRESAEQPGKILHELRRAETDHSMLRLPATYYGTVDATPLWILLLHDAWRSGMPVDEVRELLPNLERALAWLREHAVDDSGFVRYADLSGHGLVNQGWKDSPAAVRFADGRLATAPIALCEVQGYAHAAAVAGAALLDEFGLSGSDDWRSWAARLRARFRAEFWVADAEGPYPAMALDTDGTPADALASNLGHLLGTGLLDASEAESVVHRLASPALSSGFGVRTLADTAVGFDPLSYHCGSVWTHDTAVSITGLVQAAQDGIPGAADAARQLIDGLLDAAESFDYRLPELFSGERNLGGRVVPYPASCRPQAWAAASAVTLWSADRTLRSIP